MAKKATAKKPTPGAGKPATQANPNVANNKGAQFDAMVKRMMAKGMSLKVATAMATNAMKKVKGK